MKITIANDPVVTKPRTKEELSHYFYKLGFKTYEIQIQQFRELISNGYTISYIFKDDEFIRTSTYTKNNYVGTDFIVIDVDGIDVDPDTYVSRLRYQPTIYHTTFSNLTEYKDYKYCIHLIYCFNSTIFGEYNFRTVFDRISEDIDYDKRARDCHRCIFTSNSSLPGFVYRETGITYDTDEFVKDDENKLCKNESAQYIVLESKEYILSQHKFTQEGSFILNRDFIKELYSTGREEFVKKYSVRYDFYTTTRIDPSMYNDRGYADLRNISYYQVPSAQYRWDHAKNKPVIQKIRNGQRNSTLWLDAIAFMMIIRDITPENLVYCLTREVYERYINEDKELDNNFIIAKAKDVWNNIEKIDKRPVRKKFKINMSYWKEKGIEDVLKISRMIMKDMKDNDFGMYYDFSRTIEQNLKDFNVLGIKTTKRTVKKWLEENNLEYTTDRQIRDSFIIELHNQGKSTREIERICKEEGINVSNKTAANIINKLCKNESALYIVLEKEIIYQDSTNLHTTEKDETIKGMDKQSIDNWITEVTDRIKTDPFIQSHRGREYAIRIGLIKDDTPKKANVDVEFRTDEFTERIDQIKELNHTLF